MTRRSFSRMLAGLSAAFLMTGIAGQVRADSYAFSRQELNGYTFTGATASSNLTISNNNAVQQGNPSGNVQTLGTTDALEAYVGPVAGNPGENIFTAKGLTTPDYTRSDSQTIGSTLPGLSTKTVAEGYLTSNGASSSGTTSISISTPITVGTGGSVVTLSFSATNQLTATVTGPFAATAQARYTFDYTIQNAAGATVFTSSPTVVNNAVSQTTPGTSSVPLATTAVVIATPSALAAGNYTVSITQTSVVFLTTAIPEPSSIVMGSLSFSLLGGVFGWRRRMSSRTA